LDRGQKTVSGRVNSDGSIYNGTNDFLVRRTNTGDYTVVVPGVRGIRSAVASFASGNPGSASYVVVAGTNTFRVTTVNTAGASIDQHFSFTADCIP
jgi:UDP-N-acetylmuramyl tripeptide synthase